MTIDRPVYYEISSLSSKNHAPFSPTPYETTSIFSKWQMVLVEGPKPLILKDFPKVILSKHTFVSFGTEKVLVVCNNPYSAFKFKI